MSGALVRDVLILVAMIAAVVAAIANVLALKTRGWRRGLMGVLIIGAIFAVVLVLIEHRWSDQEPAIRGAGVQDEPLTNFAETDSGFGEGRKNGSPARVRNELRRTTKVYSLSTDSTIKFVGSKVTGSHEGGFKSFTGTVSVVGGRLRC